MLKRWRYCLNDDLMAGFCLGMSTISANHQNTDRSSVFWAGEINAQIG
ncbi:hypothetical protein EJK53_2151 [Moraxella catarrhalis]|uniref:Uncharacterized protein n=1 Tax=Moraxella catarrhalis TaxID=480 RepID=A0A3Q9GEF5_MORCA|nr:hypothetical protein EJK53_2151 [Moraxella catarrhalis]RUO13994.1 hypothetical protein EJK49_1112 [Moraxella catarrhalis]